MNIRSTKTQLIVFLLLFSLYAVFLNKDISGLSGILLSVACAVLTDSLFCYFKKKEITLTESSIITGLIIGIVLASSWPCWLLGLAGILAISSKHLIRFRNRHIFNPAAFGALAVVFLLGASTEWKSAYLWQIIIPVGVYISFKIRKLELIISYFTLSFMLFGSQALMQGGHVFNILGYLNYFFIFIMLIEPMTTPSTRFGKIIFGSGAGLMIFIFYALGVKEAELVSLVCLNLLTPFLNKRRG